VLLSAGVLAAIVLFQPPPEEGDVPYVVVIGSDNTTENVTLTEMLAMTSVSEYGSYQNSYGNVRGQGDYTGVKIADLVNLVGGMLENETLRVTASDEYSMTFGYYKVFPNASFLAIQGDMILAYEYNGTMVPDYEDGFRIAFLPDDGYYSNADANATTNPNPAGAGPQWVSNVVKIEVLEPTEPVALTLYYEDTTLPFTMSEIEALTPISGEGGYRTSFPSIRGPYDITGVTISTLLDLLPALPLNYTLIATAGDDYTTQYTKAMVEGHLSGYNATGYPVDLISSTMMLAYEIDGSPIPDGDGPLRITFINEDGNLTDGFLWAKNVVNLTIVEIEPIELVLNYEDTVLTFTMSELKTLTPISGEGGYKTGGGSIRGPYDITGVTIETLLNLLPTLPVNYSMIALAGDEYSTEYAKEIIEGVLSGYNASGSPVDLINSTMVLAYELDGSPIPEGDGPLRMAFINEDGNLTDGFLWAKNVVNITIVEQPVLTLNYGGTTLSFTMSDLKAMTPTSGQGGYRTGGGSIRGPYDITGVAISTLLAMLPPLPSNYTLTTVAGDGYEVQYTMKIVGGNLTGYTPTGDPLDVIYSTMVLAYEIDGSPIPEGDGPLKITYINEDGNLTDGFLWAKNVINITIVEVPAPPVPAAVPVSENTNDISSVLFQEMFLTKAKYH